MQFEFLLRKISRFDGWLVVFRINVDLAIFQPYLDLEAGDNQSLKIQVARPGIEPRSSCSASQELNHSVTTAPISRFEDFNYQRSVISKIEKVLVPRGIRVKTWQVRGILSQQFEHKQVPQWGTESGVRKGKRSQLACHTRCKYSMESTHNRWRSSSV